MPEIPRAAMTANHSSMMGPKAAPIFEDPNLWLANSTVRTRTAAGVTSAFIGGAAMFSPSRALSTEIDGVITPSP